MTAETDTQRVNRELIEMLNELRVALPGVQVLFAFLLAVPFQQRFNQATSFQRHVYFATFVAALVAIALLIAPSAYHRLNFRKNDKLNIVLISNRLILYGMVCLALAMTGVLILITDVLFGGLLVYVAPVFAAVLFVVLWAILPLRERARVEESTAERPRPAG